MALFTTTQLRERAKNEIKKSTWENLSESQFSTKIFSALSSKIRNQASALQTKNYDIFLSHSSKDADLVEGLKLELEDKGFSVYVDWIEDPQLDRSKVSKETALLLKHRMNNSKSLIYAFSENGNQSKWMPWELGYFDGIKQKATVLPILQSSIGDSYSGIEYLGIYNYVVSGPGLFVHESANKRVSYTNWLTGQKP